MPAAKSIEIQLAVENSGRASSPPIRREPYGPKASHNARPRRPETLPRTNQSMAWKIAPTTASAAAPSASGALMPNTATAMHKGTATTKRRPPW
jgi:hypothetical protein